MKRAAVPPMPDDPTTHDPRANPPGGPPATAAADRRSFLRKAAWGGGIAGLGGLAGWLANRLNRKTPPGAPKPALGAEFTYDVSRFQSSDPSLLRFEEIKRFNAGIERARNIAVAPDGSILVCGNGGIRRFSAEGELLVAVSLDGPVHAVAVRQSGEMFAGMPEQIVLLDAAGKVTATWKDLPKGLLPTSIAPAGEWIFIADAGNRVVLQVDASGKLAKTIGARDLERDIRGFVVPSPYFCVRMAPDGLLRVTNPGEHRIEAFTLDGDLETSWGKGSFAVEGFCGCCNPVSFDMFPDGSYVTGEKGLPRVKLYDSHGEFTGLVAGPEAFPDYVRAANAGTPDSLNTGIYAVVDPQGRVVVLDGVAGEVRIMKRKEESHG